MLDEMLRHEGMALSDGEAFITYAGLSRIIGKIGRRLRASGARTVGIALDNSPLWAALDLAIMDAGLICVPLPGFFSSSQLSHVISDAGIDLILTDRPAFFAQLPGVSEKFDEFEHCGRRYAEIRVGCAAGEAVPQGTVRITYTSGTTGNPKGVCLDHSAVTAVAKSLLAASQADERDRYVSVLPLSTLLENVGGLHVPLLSGACCHLLPPEKAGLGGAAKFEAGKMVEAFAKYRATCAILTPGLLQAFIGFIQRHRIALPDLRFLAVGGAPVSERLLEQSEELGLPVFEGYGLSECASVVSLNTASGRKAGSAGRPLPHVSLKFSEEGEILVKGSVMLGYCGMAPIDRNGFLP
ncbi:MAG TPA: AMP-binding protein, partial [Burkholderiales bacterium]|nr:AMP-binding protein [Burkholderiales bacterium]